MIGISIFAIACGPGAGEPTPNGLAGQPTATTIATATSTVNPVESTPVPEGTSPFTVFWPEPRVELPSVGLVADETGRSVEEILRLAAEHHDTATSFRFRAYQLGFVGSGAEIPPASPDTTEVVAPDRVRFVDPQGVVRGIGIGKKGYTPSSTGDGKWRVTESDTSSFNQLWIRPFPSKLAGAGIVDLSDPEYLVIEGYADSARRVSSERPFGIDILNLFQLKIRKEDLAVVTVTRWDLPLVVEAEKDLDLTQVLVRQSEIKSGPRFETEIFDYNADIDIQPPDEVLLVALAAPAGPRDGDTFVPKSTEISYIISYPVKIMELNITPPVELTFVREVPGEAADGSFLKRIFKPVTALENGVEYTATFNWGTNEEDMQTLSWSFTTFPSSVPRNQ